MEIGDRHANFVHPKVFEEDGKFLLDHLVAGMGLFCDYEVLLLSEISLFLG